MAAGSLDLKGNFMRKIIIASMAAAAFSLTACSDKTQDAAADAASSAADCASAGNRSVNSAPRSRPALDALIVPPCMSTSDLAKARPIPNPVCVAERGSAHRDLLGLAGVRHDCKRMRANLVEQRRLRAAERCTALPFEGELRIARDSIDPNLEVKMRSA